MLARLRLSVAPWCLPSRRRPRSRRFIRQVFICYYLLEDPKAPRQVIGQSTRMIQRAGVHPDARWSHLPGALGCGAEQNPAESLPGELGQDAEIDNLHV